MRFFCCAFLTLAPCFGVSGLVQADATQTPSTLRAQWTMPARCDPFGQPRISDLREELRQTGYRLVIAIHPDQPPNSKGEYPARHLYIVNADGTGLKQFTCTPDAEEHVPRVSPDGRFFTYNYGDFLVDTSTLKIRPISGGYVWTPDSKQTVSCEKEGFVYTDVQTGKTSPPVKVTRQVEIVDLTPDGKWFIFEIRNYLGREYTIDFMSADGQVLRKMPNHPLTKEGECHPAFSPDGKWMCWNAGDSLGIRKFDPSLPDGTDGDIITLPKEKMGQDPCGRWSHCGRYIAYVKIPHEGTWKVHSPICIVRVADAQTITLSPPGWVGHHWDYDWLPPADEGATERAR
jgi:Tol biopolymer transport system component